MKNKNQNNREETGIAVFAKTNGLNPTLALEKKRTIQNLIALGRLHKKINILIYETNALPLKELDKIKRKIGKIEAIEFQMQKEWGFELNRDMHTHWKKIKHCKCEKTAAVRHMEIARVCPVHPTQTNKLKSCCA